MMLLEQLKHAVESGKINRDTPHPPHLAGKDGATELTIRALKSAIDPQVILNEGLMPGMRAIGEKFANGEAFIPNMLISAQAMNKSVDILKPHFQDHELMSRGTLILGTVQGDLHDIGKNLVKLIMQGNGWNVVDLGTNVSGAQFVDEVNRHENAMVGMSALLTTTMLHMESNVVLLRKNNPETKIYIGGAPVSREFCNRIQADATYRDPYQFACSFD